MFTLNMIKFSAFSPNSHSAKWRMNNPEWVQEQRLTRRCDLNLFSPLDCVAVRRAACLGRGPFDLEWSDIFNPLWSFIAAVRQTDATALRFCCRVGWFSVPPSYITMHGLILLIKFDVLNRRWAMCRKIGEDLPPLPVFYFLQLFIPTEGLGLSSPTVINAAGPTYHTKYLKTTFNTYILSNRNGDRICCVIKYNDRD